MALSEDAVDLEALDRVSRLRLISKRVVQSFISGQHRSMYKGFNVEFAQHREYTQGDELRHIDWKVYGKSDRLFIKQYEEETNMVATICLDASGSMKYGNLKKSKTKFEYAQQLAAALAYLMISQSDSVGLLTFDTEIRKQIPPRSTTSHLSTLFKTMVETEPTGETNLAPILHKIGDSLKRRGLVLVLSDFFAPVEGLVEALAHFNHNRHEVILFQILDMDELIFPFNKVFEFQSLESSQHKIKLDAPRIKRFYLERLEDFMDTLRGTCHRYNYDHVLLTTDQPFDAALCQYLRRRQGR